jgi:hypothetical protein
MVSASSPAHPLFASRCEIVDATRPLLAALPPWEWAAVTNREWRGRVHPRALAVAERWTSLRGSVVLLGPSGIGKTSALRALAWRLRLEALCAGDVAHPIVNAWWCSAVELCRARRELPRGKPDLELERATKASVLFLDEIGQEDSDPRWLLELLDERYRRRRPTLTTTGLTRPQVETRYGSGSARRLVEPNGQFVDLHGGEGG